MSPKTPILTSEAPKPLPGIYSQAIVANNTVYCSGAVAMDASTGKIIEGDIKAHTVRPFIKHPSLLGPPPYPSKTQKRKEQKSERKKEAVKKKLTRRGGNSTSV